MIIKLPKRFLRPLIRKEINENVPAFSEKKDVIHINQIQSQTTIYELI